MRLTRLILIFICLFFLSAPILTAQEKAYPKKGEGIDLFLKRFNRIGYDYQKEFIRINKKKLGRNNALIAGVKYTLPPLHNKPDKEAGPSPNKKRKAYEPLFGKKLADYSPVTSELKGACFYLVSGHGGPDPGAIGKIGNHELHEDEYAYDIILRVARNLMQRGAKVHIIIQDKKDGIRDGMYLNNSKRETCMGAPIPLNQVSRLKQRCDKINALMKKDKEAYKRALFIHIDSRGKGKQMDVFFYHAGSKQGKRLANTVKKTFQRKYARHQPGRGFKGTVSQRNLYVLRNANPVSLFIEIGNIQNKYDQQRIILSNNRQALANWISEAFVADFKQASK